jgi:rubrerythrin
MEKFTSVEDILKFAIKKEQEAMDFYMNLAGKSRNPEIKEVFEEFAQEELRHKAKLQKILTMGILSLPDDVILDLKISDYTINITPKPDMTYEESLILAMNREKASYKLYINLARRVDDPGLKELFQMLAAEESKHKLRFEVEYDEYVLKEN